MPHRVLSAAAAVLILGSLWELLSTPKPLLVWNLTASAPIGLYRRSGAAVSRGDWVLIRAPHAAADLAAARRYLPRNVPMVKRVAALSGDTVCRDDYVVRVNGTVEAIALARDRLGRALPRWGGCARLHAGQIFLLTAPQASFDSRYFGPVSAANLIERIEPLWTF